MTVILALALAIGLGSTLTTHAKSDSLPSNGGFIDGVLAYRQGQYTKAEQIFLPLHDQAPDQSRITYYLALIKEQLGDFSAAKTLFEEVIALDPNSEAARMSRLALQQFPSQEQAHSKQPGVASGFQLDPPPNLTALSAPVSQELPAMPNLSNSQNAQPNSQNQQNQANNFSPQDLMMMQMMMGGGMNGNNNNGMAGGGFNPMLMQSLMNQGQNGQQGSNMDPNIMSTMMMNQMLQNFNMDFKGNNNND